MQTKLTLRMDEALIEQAKHYAKQRNKPLSRVVADYFQLLAQLDSARTPPPPVTQSLIGILEGEHLEIDDYKKHLEEKYL